eukprot:scaffold677_cov118-Isochrysis_galbana.AAC.2
MRQPHLLLQGGFARRSARRLHSHARVCAGDLGLRRAQLGQQQLESTVADGVGHPPGGRAREAVKRVGCEGKVMAMALGAAKINSFSQGVGGSTRALHVCTRAPSWAELPRCGSVGVKRQRLRRCGLAWHRGAQVPAAGGGEETRRYLYYLYHIDISIYPTSYMHTRQAYTPWQPLYAPFTLAISASGLEAQLHCARPLSTTRCSVAAGATMHGSAATVPLRSTLLALLLASPLHSRHRPLPRHRTTDTRGARRPPWLPWLAARTNA